MVRVTQGEINNRCQVTGGPGTRLSGGQFPSAISAPGESPRSREGQICQDLAAAHGRAGSGAPGWPPRLWLRSWASPAGEAGRGAKMMQNLVGWLICQMFVLPFGGIWTGWRNELTGTS